MTYSKLKKQLLEEEKIAKYISDIVVEATDGGTKINPKHLIMGVGEQEIWSFIDFITFLSSSLDKVRDETIKETKLEEYPLPLPITKEKAKAGFKIFGFNEAVQEQEDKIKKFKEEK